MLAILPKALRQAFFAKREYLKPCRELLKHCMTLESRLVPSDTGLTDADIELQEKLKDAITKACEAITLACVVSSNGPQSKPDQADDAIAAAENAIQYCLKRLGLEHTKCEIPHDKKRVESLEAAIEELARRNNVFMGPEGSSAGRDHVTLKFCEHDLDRPLKVAHYAVRGATYVLDTILFIARWQEPKIIFPGYPRFFARLENGQTFTDGKSCFVRYEATHALRGISAKANNEIELFLVLTNSAYLILVAGGERDSGLDDATFLIKDFREIITARAFQPGRRSMYHLEGALKYQFGPDEEVKYTWQDLKDQGRVREHEGKWFLVIDPISTA